MRIPDSDPFMMLQGHQGLLLLWNIWELVVDFFCKFLEFGPVQAVVLRPPRTLQYTGTKAGLLFTAEQLSGWMWLDGLQSPEGPAALEFIIAGVKGGVTSPSY